MPRISKLLTPPDRSVPTDRTCRLSAVHNRQPVSCPYLRPCIFNCDLVVIVRIFAGKEALEGAVDVDQELAWLEALDVMTGSTIAWRLHALERLKPAATASCRVDNLRQLVRYAPALRGRLLTAEYVLTLAAGPLECDWP